MINTTDLKDYVALMYHEARNVRHLISKGHLSRSGWEKIVILPRNRELAWREITNFSDSIKGDIRDVLSSFEQKFGQNLESLVAMFSNSNWKHAAFYGGNAWARIGQTVIDLVFAFQEGDYERISLLRNKLQDEKHNTGTVKEKLEGLKALTL